VDSRDANNESMRMNGAASSDDGKLRDQPGGCVAQPIAAIPFGTLP